MPLAWLSALLARHSSRQAFAVFSPPVAGVFGVAAVVLAAGVAAGVAGVAAALRDISFLRNALGLIIRLVGAPFLVAGLRGLLLRERGRAERGNAENRSGDQEHPHDKSPSNNASRRDACGAAPFTQSVDRHNPKKRAVRRPARISS